jgi:SAM-dependent methyltransferase
MAYSLPESRFLGIDLASEPIAAGQESIDALELGNIKLLAGDLRDLGADYDEFDYIIAQGLYSWVPPDVRDSLMALCRERLTPQGVAFISYNVYPGRHVRQMLREMMLYHTRHATGPVERVREARWFVEFLQNGGLLSQKWQTFLDHELDFLKTRPDDALYHDDLADYNDSVYFRDFAAHAGRHRLQYLGEADPMEMFDHGNRLAWLQDDVLEREQYLDFLRLRRYRKTLVCRD